MWWHRIWVGGACARRPHHVRHAGQREAGAQPTHGGRTPLASTPAAGTGRCSSAPCSGTSVPDGRSPRRPIMHLMLTAALPPPYSGTMDDAQHQQNAATRSLSIKHQSASQAITSRKSQAITSTLSLNNSMKSKKTRIKWGSKTKKAYVTQRMPVFFVLAGEPRIRTSTSGSRVRQCAVHGVP